MTLLGGVIHVCFVLQPLTIPVRDVFISRCRCGFDYLIILSRGDDFVTFSVKKKGVTSCGSDPFLISDFRAF